MHKVKKIEGGRGSNPFPKYGSRSKSMSGYKPSRMKSGGNIDAGDYRNTPSSMMGENHVNEVKRSKIDSSVVADVPSHMVGSKMDESVNGNFYSFPDKQMVMDSMSY